MGASAWVYWQAVDSAEGWGFFKNVLNDTQTTSYTVNQTYYVVGNYSKFIRPGYKIIGMSNANTLAAYDASSGRFGHDLRHIRHRIRFQIHQVGKPIQNFKFKKKRKTPSSIIKLLRTNKWSLSFPYYYMIPRLLNN
ncbi:hypothetical protein ACIFOE_16555, partial [Paenibacillus sp. NRS-1783]